MFGVFSDTSVVRGTLVVLLGVVCGLGCADWPLCEESCGAGRRCIQGACVDDPCKDRECGPDGYGSSCGACEGACVAGSCKRCSSDMVLIPDKYACIDRYEASIVSGHAVSKKGAMPATVTGEDATADCKSSGKRLCTFEEWNAACSAHAAHPTGCNLKTKGPVRTGSRASCEGGLIGLFDMDGNVSELIEGGKKAQGGSYMSGAVGCEGFTYQSYKVFNHNVGFRCCKPVCVGASPCLQE